MNALEPKADSRPHALGVQAQLAVGPVDDVQELEAERVADAVMRATGAGTSVSVRAPGGMRAGATIRRAPAGGPARPSGRVGRAVERDVAVQRGWGRPVAAPAQAFFRERLGSELSAVRIHADARAARTASALGANAFTSGHDVFFARGRYAPETHAGRRLLAHELAHVVQQDRAGAAPLRRQPAELAAPAAAEGAPPAALLTASLSGLRFIPEPGRTLAPGPVRRQLLAMAVARLAGPAYREALVDDVLRALADPKRVSSPSFHGEMADPAAVAQGGEPMPPLSLDAKVSRALVTYLEERNVHLDLSDDQRGLLDRAVAATAAWKDVTDDLVMELGESVPSWYTQYMFERAVAQLDEHFGQYRIVWEATRRGEPSMREAGVDALRAIVRAINEAAFVLEAIRVDLALAADPDVGGLYRLLWKVPAAPAAPGTEPEEIADEHYAATFLSWTWSQPGARQAAIGDHERRRDLLHRFVNFVERARLAREGDEEILRAPARASDPPFDGYLSASPELIPPLYEAPAESDRRFSMHIEFPSVAEAFGYYLFRWELIAVPDRKLGADQMRDQLAKARSLSRIATGETNVENLPGHVPRSSEVWAQRTERTQRYNAADIERIRTELGDEAWAAHDLIEANNRLREVGTTIQTAVDLTTARDRSNRSESIIAFPGPGLYVVRCTAAQRLEGMEEVTRPPTVAYLPVIARPAVSLAEQLTQQALEAQQQQREMLPELRSMLTSPYLPPEIREQFESMVKEYEAQAGGVAEVLELQKARLEAELEKIKPLAYHPARAGLRRELSRVEDMIETRKDRVDERGLVSAKPIVATFLSDLGATIPLRLEVADLPSVFEDGQRLQRVVLSDSTTPNSGIEEGKGKTRDAAIIDAFRNLLTGPANYGRGHGSIAIGGRPFWVPITAPKGTGLLVEALDSISMVLSIAALAAAPFTGGASLLVMIPLGLVGAGTSMYRLMSRSEAATLRPDLEAALDVVNVLGGTLGVVRAGAGVLRLTRVARVMMIVGWGENGAQVLLMGAQLAAQIEEARRLPEGERNAALLMIMGNAFLQAGMMVGGELAQHAVEARAAAAHAKREAEAGLRKVPGTEQAPGDVEARRGPAKTVAGTSPGGEGGAVRPATEPEAKGRPHGEEALDTIAREGLRRDLPAPRSTGGELLPHNADVPVPEPKSFKSAYGAYNDALNRAGGAEVGIFVDKDGNYAVRTGTKAGVEAPTGGGPWRTLLHFHPNESNAVRFRLPAPADWVEMLKLYDRDGPPLREFIEYDLPGVGRGRTEFGITPGADKPFYVRMTLEDGSTSEMRFSHDGEFDAYWSAQKIAVQPGSDLYTAMLRDVERFLAGMHGESAKTTAGVVKKGKPAKAAAAQAPPPPSPPMIDMTGQVTDEGLKYLKSLKRFASVPEGELRIRFGREGDPLELAVLEELRRLWESSGRPPEQFLIAARPGSDAFVAAPAGRPVKGKRPQISSILKELIARARKTKLVRTFDTAVPTRDVATLVATDPVLSRAAARLERSDSDVTRARWLWFFWGDIPDPALKRLVPEAELNDPDARAFGLGKVGTKRPDAVEVWLDLMRLSVLDVTQVTEDPIHQFKTLFYKRVLELMAPGFRVDATDWRSVFATHRAR
jgi:hypothetical protein